ncbi:MAG: hypothetical protein Q4P14_02410, partial [Methanobacteriaceae archaeon]|nr:hypothetical protein [Methanobacteriaceae archaeon]
MLSLKVKPFAILTGNSGTGKTKLSQLFAKYISDFEESESSTQDDSQITDDGYVTIKVKTNMSSWKNVGWTLSKKEFEGILPIRESEGNFKLEIGGIKGECSINVLPQLYYDKENTELITYFKELYDEDENQLVDMKINCEALKEFISKDYVETNGEITLQQNSNKSAIEARQWFISKKYFDYLPFDSGYTDVKIIVNGISSDA